MSVEVRSATTEIKPTDSHPWAFTAPFAATIFLGAFLLFQLQPLIGKFILPWFGGATAVWTTCMLFFQTLLLGGYAYAHLSTRFLRPRGQAVLHIALLIAALCLLPIAPSPRWKPIAGNDPTIRILALLAVCVGLPYFVLSATGPLLQAWIARQSPARQPYRLYALSNVASFLALLSYPTIFEPMLARRSQSLAWSVTLGLFAILCAYCAIQSAKHASLEFDPEQASGSSENLQPRRGGIVYALWLALPGCASLLLLAMTNKICQDVAVVPLLWVLPLAIYLLSFVICFDSPRWYDRRIFVPLMLVSLAIACWAAFPNNEEWPVPMRVAAYTIALFACCMICHGELYRLKPPPRELTAFYLMIAAGGAIGGAFVAVLAPLLFSGYTELQVGLMLSFALLMVALFVDPQSPLHRGRKPIAWIAALCAAAALALVLWITATSHLGDSRTIAQVRNFYGVLTLYQQGVGVNEHLLLHHGGVTHGVQLMTPELRRHPTAYYGPESGVGIALRSLPAGAPHRVGAIGLGAGTIATYAEPGDYFRFYEINPMVIDLARSRFTFLSDCRGSVDVIPGDARLSLESEPDQDFDLLAVDAFNGDAIPVHLLTAQCFDTYLRHLAPGGILALHVSNQHLDLEPVVRKLAQHADLSAVLVHSVPANDPYQFEARWMLLARDPATLNSELIRKATSSPGDGGRDVPLWTDDYSDLIRILR